MTGPKTLLIAASMSAALLTGGAAFAGHDDSDAINVTIVIDGKEHVIHIGEDGVKVNGARLDDIEISLEIDGDVNELADEVLEEVESVLEELGEAIEDILEDLGEA